MHCRKATRLIPFHPTPHGSWLDSDDRRELLAHLAVCDSCRKSYEETSRTVRFFRQYGAISPDTQALIDNANRKKQQQDQGTASTIRLSRVALRVAAIAAMIVLLAWVGSLVKNNPKGRSAAQRGPTPNQYVGLPLTISENGVAFPSSTLLTTSSTHVRELWINNRHRLVVHQETVLSIEPLAQEEVSGCAIHLRSGQILAEVEHDGGRFEVYTPHGKAIVTGTVLDVTATHQETTLVVVEGSVRFESSEGKVNVGAGHKSVLRAQAAPTAPSACHVESLVAWARRGETPPPIAPSAVDADFARFVEGLPLELSSPGRPVDLEAIEYDAFVENMRPWFRRHFPWIWELQTVLRNKDINTDYPDLLLKTDAIWQIVYPEQLQRIIPVMDPNSLFALAREYDLGRALLHQLMTTSRQSQVPEHGTAFGQSALERWLAECRKIHDTCLSDKDAEATYEYPRAIGEYIENTRTLVWLYLQTDRGEVAGARKAQLLELLQKEVQAARIYNQMAWHLNLCRTPRHFPRDQVLQLTETVAELVECERRIREALHD